MTYWKWLITKGKTFFIPFAFLGYIDFRTYQDYYTIPVVGLILIIILHPFAVYFSIKYWKKYINNPDNNKPAI